jgi:hypothetical protein
MACKRRAGSVVTVTWLKSVCFSAEGGELSVTMRVGGGDDGEAYLCPADGVCPWASRCRRILTGG